MWSSPTPDPYEPTPEEVYRRTLADYHAGIAAGHEVDVLESILNNWDDDCVACGRPTHETDGENDPLRLCEQASGAYVLCARCEAVAREEVTGDE